MKKRWIYSLSFLAIVSLINFACRKPSIEKADDKKPLQTRSGQVAVTISMEEIYAQLPQTIMYNLADIININVKLAEWRYEAEYLMVRIPLNQSDNKSYLYAVKPYNNPTGRPHVFLSQFLPETGSTKSDFSGKQMWLNLQDWKVYGVKYGHNNATEFMDPISINPAWESTMLDAGLFYLDNNDKINVYDDPANPDATETGMRPTDDRTHGDRLIGNGKGKGFFGRLLDGIKDAVSGIGNWLSSLGNGDGNGGPGGDNLGGGGWLSGWPDGGDYGGDGAPGGGGGYTPPPEEQAPPINIWDANMAGQLWASIDEPGISNPIPVWANGGILNNNTSIYSIENPTVAYLVNTLGLNQTQSNWLGSHLNIANNIKDFLIIYIPNQPIDQKREIAREHLIRMMDDPAYLTFVNNYDQNNTGMWWMNEDWISDPTHFYLGSNTGLIAAWNTLTAAEKTLVKGYPVQAFIIFERSGFADNTAKTSGLPGKTNGKQDAFRHAFLQAICVRDMVPRFIPIYMSRSEIVLLFSTAHESDTPPQRVLAKQMDLFNNGVGIQYGQSISIFTLDNTIKNNILNTVSNGELRYLTPVESDPPDGENGPNNDFWHVNGNPQLGRQGILSSTQIVPTNQ